MMAGDVGNSSEGGEDGWIGGWAEMEVEPGRLFEPIRAGYIRRPASTRPR
jgi:hypothetical protein